MPYLLDENLGILIVPPFRDLPSNRMNLSFAEYDAELMFYQLYFDRCSVLPFNFLVESRALLTSTLLEQVLVRNHGVVLSHPNKWEIDRFGADFVAEKAELALQSLKVKHGNEWALAAPQELDSAFQVDEVNTLIVSLRAALPCPRPDRPLADVIAFRQKHQSELRSFRHAMNKLFNGVVSGAGPKGAARIVETELAESLTAIRGATRETNSLPFFTPDLAVSYSIPKELLRAALEIAGTFIGLPPGAGTVASGVTFGLGKSRLGREPYKVPREYQYVLSGIRSSIASTFPDFPLLEDDHHNTVIQRSFLPYHFPTEIVEPGGWQNCEVDRVLDTRNSSI